jgi:HK97 family phage major capsid protein
MTLYTKARELRAKKADLWEQSREALKAVREEAREFTAEESEQWDKRRADIDALDVQIREAEDQIQAMEERQEQLDSMGEGLHDRRFSLDLGGEGPAGGGRRGEQRDGDRQRRAAFRKWACRGSGALTTEERELLASGSAPDGVPAGGDSVTLRGGGSPELRALDSTTSGAGGETIPEDFVTRIIDRMKSFGGMRRVGATILTTASGADMPYPSADDTGNVGVIVGENVAHATDGDPTFAADVLKAFTFSSKIVKVPVQLLQDSGFDLESWLMMKLAERLGRATNAFFTTGTGTGQPQGVMTAATVGKTAAAAAALAFSEIIDLKHSVDPAYRELGGRFMLHDTTLAAIKKLSIGSGDARPLWQPSRIVGEPDTIDGDPYVINQSVAEIAADAKVMAYGHFADYTIRDVRSVTLVRFAERYMDNLQVGFLAFSRHDGRYAGASHGAVKTLQMASS